MHDVTQVSADDGVVAVIALDRVADLAAFLDAVEVFVTEEPAPWPLVDVAPERGDRADLGGRHGGGGLDEHGPEPRQVSVLDDVHQRRRRADRAPAIVDAHPSQTRHGRQVDQLTGVRHPFARELVTHHTDHDVGPAGQGSRVESLFVQDAQGLAEVRRLAQDEALHARPASASRTRLRDSGRSVTQTPTALYSALANTGATGGVEACPMATAPNGP